MTVGALAGTFLVFGPATLSLAQPVPLVVITERGTAAFGVCTKTVQRPARSAIEEVFDRMDAARDASPSARADSPRSSADDVRIETRLIMLRCSGPRC